MSEANPLEEQPDIDLVGLLVHLIKTFGPFVETGDEFIKGVMLDDGEYTISVTPDGEGNLTIDVEKIR